MLARSATILLLVDMIIAGEDSVKIIELEIHYVRIVMQKAKQLLPQKCIILSPFLKTLPSVSTSIIS
jgi:hypothetical protein